MAISYIWLKDQLKGEYLAAFDKVELYASVRNIDSQTDEEMMMNLLDLLLTAQKEEKPVEKIIGSDIETFCHSYFEDYGLKNRLQKLPKKIYHFMQSVFVLELIELFFSMDDKDFDIFQYHTDLSGFIAGFTIATLLLLLLNPIIKTLMFRWKRISSTLYNTILIGLFLVLLFPALYLIDEKEMQIPILVPLAISTSYILLFTIFRAILRFRKHGSIRKKKDPLSQSFIQSIKDNVKCTLPEELVKRYEKINTRRTRRGREEMTPEAYIKKLRREGKRGFVTTILCALLLFSFFLIVVILEAFDNGLASAAILGLLLFISQIPLIFFFRIMQFGDKLRQQLLDECEQNGINILEYVEMKTAQTDTTVPEAHRDA